MVCWQNSGREYEGQENENMVKKTRRACPSDVGSIWNEPIEALQQLLLNLDAVNDSDNNSDNNTDNNTDNNSDSSVSSKSSNSSSESYSSAEEGETDETEEEYPLEHLLILRWLMTHRYLMSKEKNEYRRLKTLKVRFRCTQCLRVGPKGANHLVSRVENLQVTATMHK